MALWAWGILPFFFCPILFVESHSACCTLQFGLAILALQKRAFFTFEIGKIHLVEFQWPKSYPAFLTLVLLIVPWCKAIFTTLCTDKISVVVFMIFNHLFAPMASIKNFMAVGASMTVGYQCRRPIWIGETSPADHIAAMTLLRCRALSGSLCLCAFMHRVRNACLVLTR